VEAFIPVPLIGRTCASSPEPHPNFIEVSCGPAVRDGIGAVERAGEGARSEALAG
jgi:hypothetical protein